MEGCGGGAFFAASFLALGLGYSLYVSRLTRLRAELAGSTLFYASPASLAWMPQSFGDLIGRGVDCSKDSAPGCDALSALPRLEGPASVLRGDAEIAPVVDEYAARREGATALLLMGLGSLIAYAARQALGSWRDWLAASVAFAGWCLPMRCASCQFGRRRTRSQAQQGRLRTGLGVDRLRQRLLRCSRASLPAGHRRKLDLRQQRQYRQRLVRDGRPRGWLLLDPEFGGLRLQVPLPGGEAPQLNLT